MHTYAQKEQQPQQQKSRELPRPRAASVGILETHPILHLQRTIGNQATQWLLQQNRSGDPEALSRTKEVTRFGHDFSQIRIHAKSPASIQAKLTVSSPGDSYEQEADRIADQVMATPASTVSGVPLRIQRLAAQPMGHLEAAPASVDQALASPSRPLEQTVRQDMEPRFGHEFSEVRVHFGAAAEQSAQDVNAHAYTVGHDIVFGAGWYAPGTEAGRRLIAHELTHVMQQSEAGSELFRQPKPFGPQVESDEAVIERARVAVDASNEDWKRQGVELLGILKDPSCDDRVVNMARWRRRRASRGVSFNLEDYLEKARPYYVGQFRKTRGIAALVTTVDALREQILDGIKYANAQEGLSGGERMVTNWILGQRKNPKSVYFGQTF